MLLNLKLVSVDRPTYAAMAGCTWVPGTRIWILQSVTQVPTTSIGTQDPSAASDAGKLVSRALY